MTAELPAEQPKIDPIEAGRKLVEYLEAHSDDPAPPYEEADMPKLKDYLPTKDAND